MDLHEYSNDPRELRQQLKDATDANLSAENYIGDSRPNGYVGIPIRQNRDSGALDRSNFTVALDILTAINDATYVNRTGHWAVGWVEQIFVPATLPMMEKVAELISALCNYSILDDNHHTNLEQDEAYEYFEDTGWGDVYSQLPESTQYFLDDNYDCLEYVLDESFRGFTENGYHEHDWNTDDAVEAALEAFHTLRCVEAWRILTCNGAQIEMEFSC